MRGKIKIWSTILFLAFFMKGKAQIDEDQLGAWYMYFFSSDIGRNGFGVQGDLQYRNWNLGGDLEQLMLRGGLTFTPTNLPVKFTLGYANITTGEFNSPDIASRESRIYQEALIPQKLNSVVSLTHRFRYEQRWVDDTDLRTRWRYNIFVNVLLNKPEYTDGAFYLSFYNELFMNPYPSNGIFFDRNRTYLALGYCINRKIKVQLGTMRQTTNSWQKDQLQVSLHHTW